MTRPSEETVRDATGHGWDEWFATLADAEGDAHLGHKELVDILASEHGDRVTGWWRQMVVNEYEQHTGRREAGQTADGDYQVGASRTLDAPPERVWDTLTGPRGLERWLGGVTLQLEEGSAYEAAGPPPRDFDTAAPPRGEVRVVVPGDRVRLTWQPGGWPRASTLQVRLSDAGPGRTRVGFHHERLPNGDARESMRARWKSALTELEGTLS